MTRRYRVTIAQGLTLRSDVFVYAKDEDDAKKQALAFVPHIQRENWEVEQDSKPWVESFQVENV